MGNVIILCSFEGVKQVVMLNTSVMEMGNSCFIFRSLKCHPVKSLYVRLFPSRGLKYLWNHAKINTNRSYGFPSDKHSLTVSRFFILLIHIDFPFPLNISQYHEIFFNISSYNILLQYKLYLLGLLNKICCTSAYWKPRLFYSYFKFTQ